MSTGESPRVDFLASPSILDSWTVLTRQRTSDVDRTVQPTVDSTGNALVRLRRRTANARRCRRPGSRTRCTGRHSVRDRRGTQQAPCPGPTNQHVATCSRIGGDVGSATGRGCRNGSRLAAATHRTSSGRSLSRGELERLVGGASPALLAGFAKALRICRSLVTRVSPWTVSGRSPTSR
jgi:hypothetical protein